MITIQTTTKKTEEQYDSMMTEPTVTTSAAVSILTEHCTDEAIREYLMGMLNDKSVDQESLQDTLAQFLGDEAIAESIVQAVMTEKKQKPRTNVKTATTNVTTSSPPSTTKSIAPQRLDQAFSGGSDEELMKGDVANSTTSTTNTKTSSSTTTTTTKTSSLRAKKQQQRQTRLNKSRKPVIVDNSAEDDASAWQQCQEENMVWGGRGKGGRGAYAGRVNSIRSNIHLDAVTVSLPDGSELLNNTVMDITKGHRYGLMGRNGCGKSTLLHRLAAKSIPGLPFDLRVLLVEQQQQHAMHATERTTTLETLLRFDTERLWLLEEQERLESLLQTGTAEDMNETVQLLTDLEQDLDDLEADTAEQRAKEILKGLRFTPTMISGPVEHLSGGWRMRLAIAQALFVQSDLILLDEVTNHLDLHGLEWLIQYINESTKTIIVVSHDPVFLDAICTDIVVMSHQRLDYYVGSYTQYREHMEEIATRNAHILDASERQRAKAQAFVQKQQAMANKKSADPKKQRQAKMIREKKMDRIGNFREDGKRYQNFSLKKMDMKSARLSQKVNIEEEEAVVQLHFPNPFWPPSVPEGGDIVRFDDLSFGYNKQQKDRAILQELTLQVARGSKIALVGPNGCGKSTLMRLVGRETLPENAWSSGELWIQPNIRVGHLTQYSVEELERHADLTVVEYAEEYLRTGSSSAAIIAKASGNIRQYLGGFGLGGKHALQKIGHLSGGERMRLCFAQLLADEPHLLLLDESTNHVDLETLESMSVALNQYQGSVLMVSHNQAFLRGFCTDLWILEDGQVTVQQKDANQTFDELFTKYRQTVGATSLSSRRHMTTTLARKARQQRTGARQNASLL